MTKFVFADRYAEYGLSPSGETIASRTAPAERIVENITHAQIIDLIGVYYGASGADLTWFRDEFAKADPSFSLINNERETCVLAATILEALIRDGTDEAILGIVVGNVSGHRTPSLSNKLITLALEEMGTRSVNARKPSTGEVKIAPTQTPKLTEEIAAVAQNDWGALLSMLAKIRSEVLNSSRTISNQTANSLSTVNREVALLREESQMLWWLVSGHSRALTRSFTTLSPQQTALVAAVDLGDLTPVSRLGPVAAPAMLERIIALAKQPKGTSSKDLASIIDSVDRKDLQLLNIMPSKLPSRLAPITTAIDLARTIGNGAWHGRFLETTGLNANIEFEPVQLATQLYREHLLCQLI
jgi:hypothetical protein